MRGRRDCIERTIGPHGEAMSIGDVGSKDRDLAIKIPTFDLMIGKEVNSPPSSDHAHSTQKPQRSRRLRDRCEEAANFSIREAGGADTEINFALIKSGIQRVERV